MEVVANYKDIDFKKRRYDKKELILSVIFKFICLSLSSLSFYFFINNDIVHFNGLGNLMSYFEPYVCLLSIVMYSMFFIYDLCFLLFKKDNVTQGMHILNFINVMALVYLFLGSLIVFPSFFNNGVLLLHEPYFFILEMVLPIFAVIDFIFFNYHFYSIKKYSYYGLTLPTIYFFGFLILYIFFHYKWPSLINNGIPCNGPYPFLDSKLNKWFVNDFSNIDFKKGRYGISIFGCVIFSIVYLLIMGVIFIHLKNKRLIKKYGIIIESEVSAFQDY